MNVWLLFGEENYGPTTLLAVCGTEREAMMLKEHGDTHNVPGMYVTKYGYDDLTVVMRPIGWRTDEGLFVKTLYGGAATEK